MTLLLGSIADDFTGATDLANTLVRQGMRTVQLIDVPDAATSPSDADAVVVALKSRTIPAADAVRQSLAALPGREKEFRDGVARAIDYAKATECRTIHTMAGLWPAGKPKAEGEAVYVENVRYAADLAKKDGITVVIEPINTRDIPGYFLNTTTEGIAILDRVARDNARLQLDLYHCQIMEGDLAERTKRLMPRVSHVQIAGTPGRHEPDIGEVNYPFLYDLLDELGYAGWVGCEYRPKGATLAGLGWAKKYGIGGK